MEKVHKFEKSSGIRKISLLGKFIISEKITKIKKKITNLKKTSQQIQKNLVI